MRFRHLSSWWHAQLVVVAMLSLTACAGLPARVQRPGTVAVATPVDLLLVRRGWHVDVGFADNDLGGPLAELDKPLPGARYVLFGFGDRRYLVSHDESSCSAVAALWPGAAVLLVSGLTATPDVAFSPKQVLRLAVSKSQARAAQDFIWQSIDATYGPTMPLAPGPYPGSAYYIATARYSAVHTCNTWVAEVLQAAGVTSPSSGVLFAGQLWNDARRAGARASPATNTVVELRTGPVH